jgi:PAS domain S-box-containing protein
MGDAVFSPPDNTDDRARETALLRRIADAAPALLSYVGADSCFRYANKAYSRWFGEPSSSIIGRSIPEVLGEAAYLAVRSYISQALAGEHVSYEMQVPYAHGGSRQVRTELVPDIGPGGVVRGFVGIVTDISRSKAVAAEKMRLHRELQVERVKQHVFMRDVLAVVTEGKLHLCETAEELPPLRPAVGSPIALTQTEGLWALRCRVREAAGQGGMEEPRWQDFLTATSEAGMNAIVHAGGGVAEVGTDSSGCLQARITDTGSGILMEHLPRAALKRGFSTKNSLGHGLKMMLETTDRLFILTGHSGTQIVLEKDPEEPTPRWLLEDLA